MSELKMVNSIYFHFISHFYFQKDIEGSRRIISYHMSMVYIRTTSKSPWSSWSCFRRNLKEQYEVS